MRVPGSGPLAIVGGRLESGNAAIFAQLCRLSGGRIAVLSMASGSPLEVGAELAADFEQHGIHADAVPILVEDPGSAFDAALVARLEACGSVFFSGGDQSRIVQALMREGRETPALSAIRSLHARGGLVAGTSAGAAMMSDPMILGGTSLQALTQEIEPSDPDGFGVGPGLGFFPWGMVDQHFLQRGRIGRLLAAQLATDTRLGFGVDENTALIVEGSRARVVGETGVIVVDLGEAQSHRNNRSVSGARISYLDDGDGFDLERAVPLPAADKLALDVGTASFRGEARVRRHAFAAYTLLDLILRLVEGDPERYLADHALADDEHSGTRIRLALEREPGRSRALRSVRDDGEIRYSAVDFRLGLERLTMNRADDEPEQIPLPAVASCAAARLVLLGSSPLRWSRNAVATLLPELRAPVGVLAIASSHPRRMTREYTAWLQGIGIAAEPINVSLANIERAGRDAQLLGRIRSMGSLLFTGGDQRLMTDTLLHCGEPTPVLQAILAAAASGMTLVAVAAAAAAMGERMIVDGDSAAALRLGASEDAGFEGVVLESGLALARCGIIDQNFLSRHRLGRLLVACAATGSRRGFGLCEESGMIIDTGARRVTAIGAGGVIVVGVDPARAALGAPRFDARGLGLQLIEPGQSLDLDQDTGTASAPSATGRTLLERAVRDLARDCNDAAGGRGSAIDLARLSDTLLERAIA